MKIGNSAENTLITSTSEQPRKQFKIQATGKAFSILSNALYQHKVKAVVREIGCNAYDAHIDAGTTSTPFKVSLPTKEDPHFKVRDFGIGLAEDKFVEVYTTYFGSSKADSNDHTGGLGLGSKTPFIMSKTFTVHSYYEGMEYMWHSYVNDNGEPDVVLLTKKETTEPNGLLVIVPIGQGMSDTEKNALFRDFAAEAQTIYQWFGTIPDVTSNGKTVTIKPQLSLSTSKYTALQLKGIENTSVWFETDHSTGSQASSILIKMGNVVYPYNLTEVKNLDRFGGAVGHAERMIRYLTSTGRLNSTKAPLVIDVAMGDVDIAPSRESLSLSNTTELTIINALVRFTDMFFDGVQTKIDGAKSTFEKYQALFSVPAMGGRKFKVDGVEVDPREQPACWAFGTNAALSGRTSFLRKFSTDDFVIKYRRAGTRGILPMTASFDVTMYGPGIKDRSIILVDSAYKGELRLWVNANTKVDAAVVVVFGRDISGTARPMTAAEMEPFLADKHPQVVKLSSLVAPVTTTTKSSTLSLKISDDSMFEMSQLNEYNFFTVGNSSLGHLNTIKPFVKGDKISTVYVAYERLSGCVYGELKTQGDKKKTEKVELATWSRSTSSYTSYSDGCSRIYRLFGHFMPQTLTLKGKAKPTFEHDGVQHQVVVKHVVLNKEGYAAIVGNPDYPQFLTLDQAIEKLVTPLVTTDILVTVVDNNDAFCYNHSNQSPIWKLFNELGWTGYIAFQHGLDRKSRAQTNDLQLKYTGHEWVKNRHYGSMTTTKVVTETYSFSFTALKLAVNEADLQGIPGAGVIKLLLSWVNPSELFQSNYYSSGAQLKVALGFMNQLLIDRGYNKSDMDDFLIKYAEKTRKIS